MQDVAGAQSDALDGGALWAGWASAVLAQAEGAPAAAAAGPEANIVKVPDRLCSSSQVRSTCVHTGRAMETSDWLAALALLVSVLSIILAWRTSSRQNLLSADQTRMQGELLRIEEARHAEESLGRSRATLRARLWRDAHRGALEVTNQGSEARNLRITIDGQPLAEHMHFRHGYHPVETIGAGAVASFHMFTVDGMPMVFQVALRWEDDSGVPGEWKSDLTVHWL